MAGHIGAVETSGEQTIAELEREVYQRHQVEAEKEIVEEVQRRLNSASLMLIVRAYGARTAHRFCGWRYVNVRLASGNSYKVRSPLFVRAKPKDRRRKRYRRDVTRHLGLEYLGFHRRCSPELLRRSIPMAVLCPSFEVAAAALNDLGTQMNHSLLRRITYGLGRAAIADRAGNVVDEQWRAPGLRILICVDGGRLRQRRARRGRKRKGAKRQGYHTDWTEPRVITITCVDEKGKMRKDIRPIYDGTPADLDGVFTLLEQYLAQINVKQAFSVTFCADGGQGIWPRIDKIAKTLPLPLANVHRVLDYTHAKQNLADIVDQIHQATGIWDYEYEAVMTELKEHLWHGRIEAIESFICQRLRRKRQKKKALKKLHDYFGDHTKFQYARLQQAGVPIGSGTVESAIRRIINLRIKGAGLFWKPENAEIMIFLRSQVLSRRWPTVLLKVLDAPRNQLHDTPLHKDALAA